MRHITTYTYDLSARKRRGKEASPGNASAPADPSGDKGQEKEPAALATRFIVTFTYDKERRCRSVQEANGVLTTMIWDGSGYRMEKTP